MRRRDPTTDYDARALGLQPDDAGASVELAKVLIAMNEHEKAEHLLERAVQLDPTDFRRSLPSQHTVSARWKANPGGRGACRYHTYKDMKDKLEKVFHDMRVNTNQKSPDDIDAPR